MKTKLMASVCVFGLLFGYSSVTLAGGKQPDDAIKQNIDKNGAFHTCGGGGAITNGHVVFGANSAIVPLSGNGGQNKPTNGTSAVVGTQTAPACGMNNAQRVEPRSWWDSLARVFNNALAGAQKRGQ